ncbi:MAG: PspA/IM30 family protein [Gloeocapsa sp. DLM2.Bin57]|nr:MAG: PspA/IM30 family protein [Gloeocapsa sp. DLM2.Bin57]
MGLLDRVSRVFRSNLNDLVSKAEDPEKVLEQAVIDMQQDLVKLRQAVAQAIAGEKRTEAQYKQNISEAEKWQQRAQLALQKGEESLAREALTRKKTYSETANVLKQQLEVQSKQVEELRRNLLGLESKISEAKTKKDMLKARASAAKANQQLQGTLSSIDTNSAMAAFERMEEKVMIEEAKSQAIGEIAGGGLDDQFRELEAGSGVEDELAAMKAALNSAPAPQALPSSSTTQPPTDSQTPIDAELEELRRQLNQ